MSWQTEPPGKAKKRTVKTTGFKKMPGIARDQSPATWEALNNHLDAIEAHTKASDVSLGQMALVLAMQGYKIEPPEAHGRVRYGPDQNIDAFHLGVLPKVDLVEAATWHLHGNLPSGMAAATMGVGHVDSEPAPSEAAEKLMDRAAQSREHSRDWFHAIGGEAEAFEEISEEDRLSLLKEAASPNPELAPHIAYERVAWMDAEKLLGGVNVLGGSLLNKEALRGAIKAGFPAESVTAVNKHGFSDAFLAKAVATVRTLSRRKTKGERLTTQESDALWRVVYALSYGSNVFDGKKGISKWFNNPRRDLGGDSPIEALKDSVGTDLVMTKLRTLNLGGAA